MGKMLNDIMEFEHVIYVAAFGAVTDAPHMHAPEIYVVTDADGQILDEYERGMVEYVRSQGWELLRGYTGQDSYNGPLMHPSEYIGGRMEDDILEQPGYYVALVVETADDSDEPAGWVVAFQEE